MVEGTIRKQYWWTEILFMDFQFPCLLNFLICQMGWHLPPHNIYMMSIGNLCDIFFVNLWTIISNYLLIVELDMSSVGSGLMWICVLYRIFKFWAFYTGLEMFGRWLSMGLECLGFHFSTNTTLRLLVFFFPF